MINLFYVNLKKILLRWDIILLLANTVISMTRSIIIYYDSWLTHARNELIRNSTLLVLFNEEEKEEVIEDECLFMRSDKTEVAKADQAERNKYN